MHGHKNIKMPCMRKDQLFNTFRNLENRNVKIFNKFAKIMSCSKTSNPHSFAPKPHVEFPN